MADLIDRLCHGDVGERPVIAAHAWKASQDLYANSLMTRAEIETEFGLTGYTDELRQWGQIADNIDAQRSYIAVCLNGTNITWSNMPAAITEIFGLTHRRHILDLTHFDKVGLAARVSTAGAANAVIWAQYSTDGGSNWSDLMANRLALAPAGTKGTTWEAIPTEARGLVQVRLVGQNGDGAADPILGIISLGLNGTYNRTEYQSVVEAVLIKSQSQEDTFYHTGQALNKTKIFSHLGIAG